MTAYIPLNILSALPVWAMMFLCINPIIGLSLYQHLAFKAPNCNFSFKAVIFDFPSVNLIVGCCVGWLGFWIVLAVYLDWLKVSSDKTRSFFISLLNLSKKLIQ